MWFKPIFTEHVPADGEHQFLQTGIAVFHGRARFTDKTTIKVGDDTLIGRFVLVVAGARPATLNVPGEEYLTTNDEFLELDPLPSPIIFLVAVHISPSL